MTATQSTLFFPEEAEVRAHDIFEVILEGWGTAITDRWPLSVASSGTSDFPGLPFSPAGVAIGPLSTVDRVWMSWNTQRQYPPPPSLQFEQFLQRVLSVESPLLFTQPVGPPGTAPEVPPAGVSPISNAMRLGLLYFFPTGANPLLSPYFPSTTNRLQSTLLPTSYLKANGVSNNFGSTGTSTFDAPVLHLQFLLRKDLLPPAPKRFPYNYSGSGAFDAIATEACIGQIPVFGRKNVVIQLRSSVAGTTFRIGALRGMNNQLLVLQETTEGEKTATAANESVRFQLCGPAADYVTIYATGGILSPPIGGSADFLLTAHD